MPEKFCYARRGIFHEEHKELIAAREIILDDMFYWAFDCADWQVNVCLWAYDPECQTAWMQLRQDIAALCHGEANVVQSASKAANFFETFASKVLRTVDHLIVERQPACMQQVKDLIADPLFTLPDWWCHEFGHEKNIFPSVNVTQYPSALCRLLYSAVRHGTPFPSAKLTAFRKRVCRAIPVARRVTIPAPLHNVLIVDPERAHCDEQSLLSESPFSWLPRDLLYKIFNLLTVADVVSLSSVFEMVLLAALSWDPHRHRHGKTSCWRIEGQSALGHEQGVRPCSPVVAYIITNCDWMPAGPVVKISVVDEGVQLLPLDAGKVASDLGHAFFQSVTESALRVHVRPSQVSWLEVDEKSSMQLDALGFSSTDYRLASIESGSLTLTRGTGITVPECSFDGCACCCGDHRCKRHNNHRRPGTPASWNSSISSDGNAPAVNIISRPAIYNAALLSARNRWRCALPVVDGRCFDSVSSASSLLLCARHCGLVGERDSNDSDKVQKWCISDQCRSRPKKQGFGGCNLAKVHCPYSLCGRCCKHCELAKSVRSSSEHTLCLERWVDKPSAVDFTAVTCTTAGCHKLASQLCTARCCALHCRVESCRGHRNKKRRERKVVN